MTPMFSPAPAMAPARLSNKPMALPDLPIDPLDSAQTAGLRYVHDTGPGITRKRVGGEFLYLGPDGKEITDEATLARIKSLAIPPAYTDVWICPYANGHLQATGRDAKGRKQYRYHPHWREVRDSTKYERSVAFADALPAIRARVEHDLARAGIPREKVLATITRLLEVTMIRVGNEEYARSNHSYGLTTLRGKHVDVEGATLHFHFRGKSGKDHRVDIRDRRLAKIVRRCQELPGQDLFEYIDHEGQVHAITSSDVNAYLREISGEDFTAKDFRTWEGTVLAALALAECQAFDSQTQAKKNIVRVVELVAQRLGNTPAVCRKCYIHPEVLSAYLDGSLEGALSRSNPEEISGAAHALAEEEEAVAALLRDRLAR